MEADDTFFRFATELADGERWKVLQADDWEDFQERLAQTVGELPVRRRQALMMLLYGMVEGFVGSPELAAWLEEHDVATEEGVEALIAWLRRLRADDGK